jgi:hypothetical protein
VKLCRTRLDKERTTEDATKRLTFEVGLPSPVQAVKQHQNHDLLKTEQVKNGKPKTVLEYIMRIARDNTTFGLLVFSLRFYKATTKSPFSKANAAKKKNVLVTNVPLNDVSIKQFSTKMHNYNFFSHALYISRIKWPKYLRHETRRNNTYKMSVLTSHWTQPVSIIKNESFNVIAMSK